MNKEQLFSFYEKLYFQELERREKLNARLNVPLAILVADIGFLSVMLNSAPASISDWFSFLFWVFFLSACLATGLGAWFFKGSWFGHTDMLLPTANQTEAYRDQLIELYKDFDENEQIVESALKAYLYDYYKRFSSENTVNNDARSYQLYRATSAITIAVLLAFAAFVPHFFIKQEGLKHGNQAATAATAAATQKREGQRSETINASSAPKAEQTAK